MMAGPPFFESTTSAHRRTLARLRIIRAAVAYLLDGAVPEFDDPFGGKLLTRKESSKLKIWSAGRDGGDGKLLKLPTSTKDQDIVMEVALPVTK